MVVEMGMPNLLSKPTGINLGESSRTSHPPRTQPPQEPEMSDNRITVPAAIRAINALLEDHYMITTSWGEEQCATCIENGGAIGAIEADWPCDIYATIQDALGDQK